MGQKHVTIDSNNIVREVYDEDNNNVPDGALPITDSEMAMFNNDYIFSDFEMVNDKLQLITNAADNVKERKVNAFSPETFELFMEVIVDELNSIRGGNPTNVADLKASMKAKLP